jgi:hypothetical protein
MRAAVARGRKSSTTTSAPVAARRSGASATGGARRIVTIREWTFERVRARRAAHGAAVRAGRRAMNPGESYAYGASAPTDESSSPLARAQTKLAQRLQIFLDKSVPKRAERWSAYACVALVYAIRAYFLRGYYIVTYGLGIYNLNLLIGFLSPRNDPESLRASNDGDDGPSLPTSNEQEFKPFVRRLPEFKFWWMSLKSIGTAFAMTFMPMFDIPVFWPILLMYFIMLFFMTMKQQVKHMIKHKYVPFTTGKPKFAGASAGGSGGLKNND